MPRTFPPFGVPARSPPSTARDDRHMTTIEQARAVTDAKDLVSAQLDVVDALLMDGWQLTTSTEWESTSAAAYRDSAATWCREWATMRGVMAVEIDNLRAAACRMWAEVTSP